MNAMLGDELTPELELLVVSLDLDARAELVALLEREGCRCLTASTASEARKLLADAPIDAALVDLALPERAAFDLIGGLDAIGTPIFVGFGSDVAAAAEAARRGALTCLATPFAVARVRGLVSKLRDARPQGRGWEDASAPVCELDRFGSLVGRSESMHRVYRLIERVAPTNASVLVVGESGTGKELVASTIHWLSPRRARPCVAVNCGSLAPTLVESELFGHEKGSFTGAERRHVGYFERANGGTLFLDEITEMSPDLQVKLLRALEARAILRVGAAEATSIDVRIVAASNRDPLEAVEQGRLREDLFYRLNVFPIELPPLRERGEDVVLLAQHFLDQLNRSQDARKRFSPRSLARMRDAAWPGNVRELKNTVERAAILADRVIDLDLLPTSPARAPRCDGHMRVRVGSTLAEIERQAILSTLEALGGSKSDAARALGISVKTLYNRLAVYRARERSAPARAELLG
jgi:DNA-binding NtrC family response regulator